MEIQKYHDCIKHLNSKRRNLNLLLGNGFSRSYNEKIFSYNALQEFLDNIKDPVLSQLFDIVKTKNLEVIMQQLDTFNKMLDFFESDKSLKIKVKTAELLLRKGLIDAIKEMHPENIFRIQESCFQSCAQFIKPYLEDQCKIFSTNYDLLLYWALIRTKLEHNDGFGRIRESGDDWVPLEELIYSKELIWGVNRDKQNIYYLHGALHLFDQGTQIEKAEYEKSLNGSTYLLEAIAKRMQNQKYPIFVTAGNGDNKLNQIIHNPYLNYCYQTLSKITGSLITFGFNFGDYDSHIIDAINIAHKPNVKTGEKLHSIYIGIFSENDKDYISSIKGKFKCKVNLFDSKDVGIWKNC